MNELRDQLVAKAENILNSLEGKDPTSEEYKKGMETVNDIYKTISEVDERESGVILKKQQCRTDKVHRVIDTSLNVVGTISKIAIPSAIAVLSLGLEKYGTMSFSSGRDAIKDCWNMLKK